MNIHDLSSETRLRISVARQREKSTLSAGEFIEALLVEALNYRDAKEQQRGDIRKVAEIMGVKL